MCLWHEGVARRGGNKISSCFLSALNMGIMRNKNKLIIWSENCAAQNKNRMMVLSTVFSCLVESLKP